jgi:protein involved in polysaccharide export with SLBB domain
MCSKPHHWRLVAAIALCVAAMTGCSPYKNPIPSACVRPSFFDNPRGNKKPINYIRLRQDTPEVYMLGPRDILGIFIEGVLGRVEESPPVHFPDQPNLPPAIGYPIPIREDGTLSLPLIPPINCTGLSLAQTEYEIRKAYTVDRAILQADRARIIVTLMKPRDYNVLVVREDNVTLGVGAGQSAGVTYGEPGRHGQAKEVQLRAYENDVLHALIQTGGMPGLDARNEIYIIRGGFKGASFAETQRALDNPAARAELLGSHNPNIIKIPLRLGPQDPAPTFTPDDIVLNNGDVVFLESRGAEVFYTGGLLQGRQIAIPRDYDLDVIGAVALAGGSVATSAGGNPNRNNGGSIGNLFPPSRVIVVRQIGKEIRTIKVSLRTALTDPQERVLIQPNDYIICEYTESELVMNIILNAVTFSFSLDQVFGR